MNKIAEIICKWLIKTGGISADDRELYQYAIYSFLFEFAPLIIVLILGYIIKIPLEGILFIVPFLLIRKFSGGFHLQSATVCFCLSSIVLFLFLLFIKRMLYFQIAILFSCIVVLAAVCIIMFSPIDSEARQLSPKEKKVFRKVAIVLTIIILGSYAISSAFGWTHIAIPMGSGLILTALLQLPCLMNRKKKDT